MANRLIYYQYIKYRSKYINLKKQINGGSSYTMSRHQTKEEYAVDFEGDDGSSYTTGAINIFEGNGGTRAIDIYRNKILIGRVICSPFCLYGKLNLLNNSINIKKSDILKIEKKGYMQFIISNSI